MQKVRSADTAGDGAVRTVRRRHARYEAVDGRYAQVYVRVAVKRIMISAVRPSLTRGIKRGTLGTQCSFRGVCFTRLLFLTAEPCFSGYFCLSLCQLSQALELGFYP